MDQIKLNIKLSYMKPVESVHFNGIDGSVQLEPTISYLFD